MIPPVSHVHSCYETVRVFMSESNEVGSCRLWDKITITGQPATRRRRSSPTFFSLSLGLLSLSASNNASCFFDCYSAPAKHLVASTW